MRHNDRPYPPLFLVQDFYILTFLYFWILFIYFIRLPKEKHK
jgi:hypothetical protein